MYCPEDPKSEAAQEVACRVRRIDELLAPASMERMNAAVHRALAIGWQEINAAGGIEAYNQIARRKREIFSLQELLSAQSLKHYDKTVITRV